MSSSSSQVVGYKYYVGMHMVLCHGPIDKVTKIKIDDKLAWEGSQSTNGDISINKPDLFGGDTKEGGVVGTVALALGGPSQTANSYLVSKLGALVPAFRRVTSLILEHVYIGMNPYLKVWSIFAQRIHKAQEGATQWQDSLAQIDVTVYDENGDPVTIPAMNPAHIIRECLTNTLWGMGYTSGDIDETSFAAAAQTLYDEGMGMCIIWDTQKSIEDFVKLVQQHIAADVFVDRRTGKFNLKLVRDDYDEGSLLVLDPSNVDKVDDVRRPAFGELCNSITIKYHDVLNDQEASMSLQDIASIQEQGGEVNTPVTYEGFVDADTVGKVLQRDLTALGTPLISCTVYATKVARDLNIGSVFKLTWPDALMSETIMRVTEIAYGNGRQKRVRIKCIQDAFAFPTQSLVTRPSTGWTNPTGAPTAPTEQLMFELPYMTLVQRAGSASAVNAALAEQPLLGYAGAAASRPPEVAINGSYYTDPGSGYSYAAEIDFSPAGTLSANLAPLDNVVTVTGGQDLDFVTTNTWLQIDDELMAVTDVSASPSFTVNRGVLDTTPRAHTAGATVMFWYGNETADPDEYIESDVVDGKVITHSSYGSSDLSSATAMTLTMGARAIRPLLPGQIAFDGDYFPPDTAIYGSTVTLSWAHRNRKLQTGGTLIGFEDAGITVEPGTTYEVRVYDSADTLLHTYSGISGTSQVISSADYGFLPDPFLTVQLDAVRDTYYSFQTFEWTITVPLVEELEDGSGAIELEDGSGFLELEDGTSPGGGGGGGGALAIRDSGVGIISSNPTHAAGDLLVAFAFRDGSTTKPTVPTGDGWTEVATDSSGGSSFVLATKTATSSSDAGGNFDNATGIIMVAISGTGPIDIGGIATDAYLGTAIRYPGITLDNTDGSSLALAFAGHRSTNTSLETPPSPWTNFETYNDATNELAAHYIIGPTSVAGTNRSVGGTSAGWGTVVVEIKH